MCFFYKKFLSLCSLVNVYSIRVPSGHWIRSCPFIQVLGLFVRCQLPPQPDTNIHKKPQYINCSFSFSNYLNFLSFVGSLSSRSPTDETVQSTTNWFSHCLRVQHHQDSQLIKGTVTSWCYDFIMTMCLLSLRILMMLHQQ